MFNVTVLKMKDIKKYIIGMLATVILTITISKYFSRKNHKRKNSSGEFICPKQYDKMFRTSSTNYVNQSRI